MRLIKIALMSMMMCLMLVPVAWAADVTVVDEVGHTWISSDFVFVDKADDATLGQDYGYVIPLQVQTGTGKEGVETVEEGDSRRGVDFVFSLTNGSTLPAGLTMTNTGVISGCPSEGFSGPLWVEVKDTNGEVRARRDIYFTVNYKTVTLSIAAITRKWTAADSAAGYKAAFAINEQTALDEGVELSDFKVTYRNIDDGTTYEGDLDTTTVADCGTYEVKVTGLATLTGKSYVLRSGKLVTLTIKPNDEATITMANQEVNYRDTYTMRPTTNPAELGYKLYFKGTDLSGASYAGSTPPTNAGTYIVTATLNQKNYSTAITTQATLKIAPLKVNVAFATQTNGEGDAPVQGDDGYVYFEKTYSPTTFPKMYAYVLEDSTSMGIDNDDLRVLYDGKLEVQYTAMPEVGDYILSSNLADTNYIAVYPKAKLRITQASILVNIENTELVLTGDSVAPVVTIGSNADKVAYTFLDASGGDVGKVLTKPGVYTLQAEISDDELAKNYKLNLIKTTVNVNTQPKLELLPGNSPAAQDKDFVTNDYTLNSVKYGWGETANPDIDPNAFYVYQSDTKLAKWYENLPLCTLSKGTETGIELARDKFSITVGGTNVADLGTLNVGIYTVAYGATVRYGADYYPVVAERTLVVLPDLAVGDVNGDGYVNVGDARYLQNVLLAANGPDNLEKLYLYRVCDVNHDGAVDADDAKAILNRMNKPLVGYYSYLQD